MTPKPQLQNKEQAAAFRKAARQLGCEPDEKRFQNALRTVAKAKPHDPPKRSSPSTKTKA
jgi:hypothetical protein